MPVISIGGVTPTPITEVNRRLTMLLWGKAGSGKTTLASTAPGDILWLNFDPEGYASIADVPGIVVADFSKEPFSYVNKFKTENPADLDKYLAENPQIKTVVADSVTMFTEAALVDGLPRASGKTFKATIDLPGQAGYGIRNRVALAMVRNLLMITGKHNRHMIFICHENQPTTSPEGVITEISILLGGSLPEFVPLQISEVWHVSDTGREHRIAVRPARMRSPMKSRMFLTNKSPEFRWVFDPITREGDHISDWYEQWVNNGGKKIALPN